MKNRQKKFISAVCILLAVLMALSVILMVIPTAKAVSEADIEALQRRRAALAEELERQGAVILALADNHALIIDRKAALDRQIELNREDISLLEEEMRFYDALAEEKEQELSAAVEEETHHSEQFRARTRAMEESGEYTYLDFVFAAKSLADLLSRMGDVSDLMRYDRDLEQSLKEARAEVELRREECELVRLEQERVQEELTLRQEQLSGQVTAAGELIDRLDKLGDAALAEYAAIEAAEAQAIQEEQAALARLAQEREAARQAALAMMYSANPSGGTSSGYTGTYESTYGANVSLGSGSFIWPDGCWKLPP